MQFGQDFIGAIEARGRQKQGYFRLAFCIFKKQNACGTWDKCFRNNIKLT
jgi:hypothetical protein